MGIPQPKKKPPVTITKLKERLWKLCREIIRARWGNTCYTCFKRNLEGSNRHTGHFITSSTCSAAMRYDLDNLRPQCYACNIHKSGNWVEFEAHLRRDGIDPEELKQRNRDTQGLQYDRTWYENKITSYSTLLNNITNGNI